MSTKPSSNYQLIDAGNFKKGQKLTISIDLKFIEDGLCSFSGNIFEGDTKLVSANVSTFKPNKNQLTNLREGRAV